MTKRHAPAAERNKTYIAEVLSQSLPEEGKVLEIASGTGQHAVYFAESFPHLTWQPSDPDPHALESISSWCEESDLPNLLSPLHIDATMSDWVVGEMSAVICINMIHISPWESCIGLIEGASKYLTEGGLLYLYGPFQIDGVHTAPSNERFDESLRMRDSSWGVRDLTTVKKLAESHKFLCSAVVDMPANNKSVLFVRR